MCIRCGLGALGSLPLAHLADANETNVRNPRLIHLLMNCLHKSTASSWSPVSTQEFDLVWDWERGCYPQSWIEKMQIAYTRKQQLVTKMYTPPKAEATSSNLCRRSWAPAEAMPPERIRNQLKRGSLESMRWEGINIEDGNADKEAEKLIPSPNFYVLMVCS